jgi:hypothetical protein
MEIYWHAAILQAHSVLSAFLSPSLENGFAGPLQQRLTREEWPVPMSSLHDASL